MRRRMFLCFIAGAAAIAFACVRPTDAQASALGSFSPPAYRVWFECASVLLAAAPFVALGAFAAAAAQRISRTVLGQRLPAIAPGLLAAFSPGCDCASNGFARLLASGSPLVAGFSLVWGACCNPVALFVTHAVLGPRLLMARIAAGAIAAALTALAWLGLDRRNRKLCSGRSLDRPLEDRPSENHHAPLELFGSGMMTLAPAALATALLVSLFPNAVRHHAAPFAAALLAAVMSPCSTSDALLARILAASPAAQAAFIVGAQCFDLRQLFMLHRTFGAAQTALAAVAAIAGCIVAIMVANR